VKTTSAGFLLALVVVAALVFGGCGGGSSDTSSRGSDSTSDALAGSGSSSGKASSVTPSGAGDKAGTGVGGTSSAHDASGGSTTSAKGQSSDGTRHGTHVPLPEGEPEPGITPQQRREATVASMTLESPSSRPSSAGPQALSATYTCDGKGTSPALRWQGVPQGTAELVLFAMNVQPVDGKLFFDWAVAGLSPDLTEVEAGKLPNGAVLGRNGFGKTAYEICPEGSGETYVFTVFALPKKLSPAQGFEPSALRREVLGASGNIGLLALSYARG
jgi:phosphatidylethanolamine-binding protein (PEBP) family uncharacterized protein